MYACIVNSVIKILLCHYTGSSLVRRHCHPLHSEIPKAFFSQLILCWWCPVPEGPLRSGIVFTLWLVQFLLIKNFSVLVLPTLSSGAWSEPLSNHSVYTECTGRAVSNPGKILVLLVSAFNLRTMTFRKEERRGGGESHRTKSGKWREKGKRSRVSRVSGQGAATAAESRIHIRYFWSWSDWYCCSKPVHISFTPNTSWSHRRKASWGFGHHNYYKKQRSGCKEQAKRMPNQQYFTIYPLAVFQ